MRFDVCLETGPRHRKTMAHAVTLPGATAMGPTVDDAIEHLAAAVQARIAFLRRHGEPFPEPEPLEVVVTEMDMSGDFLGYGAVSFAADRAANDTDEERSQVVQRGRTAQTARRILRKMLEHEWEHVLELQARLTG